MIYQTSYVIYIYIIIGLVIVQDCSPWTVTGVVISESDSFLSTTLTAYWLCDISHNSNWREDPNSYIVGLVVPSRAISNIISKPRCEDKTYHHQFQMNTICNWREQRKESLTIISGKALSMTLLTVVLLQMPSGVVSHVSRGGVTLVIRGGVTC